MKSLDLATVISKKNDSTGLERGDLVMVVGMEMYPASSSDPYLHRQLAMVVKVKDDVPDLTTKYLFDPRKLEKVSDERQEEFEESLSARRISTKG